MDITVCQFKGRVPVVLVRLCGDLDASTYRDLIAEARELYYAGGVRDVLLDLSDMPCVTLSGLVALHHIAVMFLGEEPADPDLGWSAIHAVSWDRDRAAHPHLKLLNPRPNLVRVLEMAGLERFLAGYTDIKRAIASF